MPFFLLEGKLQSNIKSLLLSSNLNTCLTYKKFFLAVLSDLVFKKDTTLPVCYFREVISNQTPCLKVYFLLFKGKIVETEEDEEVLLALRGGHRHRFLTIINLVFMISSL